MTNSQAQIDNDYMELINYVYIYMNMKKPYMLKLFIPLPTCDGCFMLNVAS